jgi:hypothetical protein
VIFDSTQRINTGSGVYMSAHAEPLADPEIDRATASDYSMIGPGMPRAPVNLPA